MNFHSYIRWSTYYVDMEFLTLTLFDIGTKNLAVYSEHADIDVLKKLRKEYQALPKSHKRRVKGQMNSDIKRILREIYKSSKAVHMNTTDLMPGVKNPDYTVEVRLKLIEFLESNRNLWAKSDIIVLEQQYYCSFTPKGKKGKGTEANVKAIKAAEGIFMWFLINYPGKEIEYFGSTYKTQMLGAPDSLTKSQRKRWSDEKAKEIAVLRGDEVMEQFFETFKQKKKKTDDGSDACTMGQAYKFRRFVADF